MSTLFSFLFPTLLLLLIMQSILKRFGKPAGGWRVTVILGILSAAAAILPVGGIPLARWPLSLNANFCIPLTVLVFSRVWGNVSGKELLDRQGKRSLHLFGVAAGLLLYPMALGLGLFDPYGLGWEFSWFFVVIMVLTIVMLYRKNALGVVLLLCIISYNFQLLESHNYWDYLVDPFFLIVSCVGIAKKLD
ncbi:MAG: hypothetical protein GY757_41040 [bacterium]|nr:hypothetical protein [bacterium]